MENPSDLHKRLLKDLHHSLNARQQLLEVSHGYAADLVHALDNQVKIIMKDLLNAQLL